MKFLMILILVIACTYVGYGFSKYYVLRHEFFTQLQLFFKKVNLEINFSREKLKPIVSQYETTSKDLEKILSNFLNALEENNLSAKKLFEGTKHLQEDEQNLLFLFFNSLGHFDLLGQTDHINNYIKNFEIVLQAARQDKDKYGTLFTKLGLIVGVVISLILI